LPTWLYELLSTLLTVVILCYKSFDRDCWHEILTIDMIAEPYREGSHGRGLGTDAHYWSGFSLIADTYGTGFTNLDRLGGF
jgi:hypothetical protein